MLLSDDGLRRRSARGGVVLERRANDLPAPRIGALAEQRQRTVVLDLLSLGDDAIVCRSERVVLYANAVSRRGGGYTQRKIVSRMRRRLCASSSSCPKRQ